MEGTILPPGMVVAGAWNWDCNCDWSSAFRARRREEVVGGKEEAFWEERSSVDKISSSDSSLASRESVSDPVSGFSSGGFVAGLSDWVGAWEVMVCFALLCLVGLNLFLSRGLKVEIGCVLGFNVRT